MTVEANQDNHRPAGSEGSGGQSHVDHRDRLRRLIVLWLVRFISDPELFIEISLDRATTGCVYALIALDTRSSTASSADQLRARRRLRPFGSRGVLDLDQLCSG
jgi:hypothetical protein